MANEVHLTPLELNVAWFVAQQRNRDGESADADAGKYGYSGDQLNLHLQGCLGEIAFAKARNLYWSGMGVGYYEDDDVGHVQIRTTHHQHGCLLVRPTEGHLDRPWVLVIGSGADYRLVGWLYGHEARREEWLQPRNGRPPAFFAPQSALRAIPPRPSRLT